MKYFAFSLFIIFAVSCKKTEVKESIISPKPDTISQKNDSISLNSDSLNLSKEELVKNANTELLQALNTKNYQKILAFIHPEKGVRFSMYAYIDPAGDKKISRADFEKYINSNVKFTWGEKDGSGEAYVETLRNYLQNWVSKADFTKSNYSLNTFQGGGNSLNNLEEIYPNADFTENYVTGTEKYGGMDWKTLRLVFEKFEGKYYLVAVINDEWTI